jgi:hypothetical protein
MIISPACNFGLNFKRISKKADVFISERCKNEFETNYKTLSKSSPRILPFKGY